jgi:quinoprotein glucose dehydrogenase
MTGHAFIGAQIELDATLYPGMNEQHSLISRKFFRCAGDAVRPARPARVGELRRPRSAAEGCGRQAAARGCAAGGLARSRRRGAARVRAYYDVHPSADSALTLDPSKKNRWGDPLPAIRHVLDEPTKARAAATREHILGVFEQLAKANNGACSNVSEGSYLDHPAGGCRMGTDPATSVCDSYGRTHDHENLFVVGSPTLPTGGARTRRSRSSR